jgi:2,4-diketo-3-deoxy-L-fuconate hydrolase
MKKIVLALLCTIAAGLAHAQVSDRADTPFKLASFEANGQLHLGLLVGDRLFDAQAASRYLSREAGLPAIEMPDNMLTLIERYDALRGRLYQIANYFNGRTGTFDFAYTPAQVAIKAPIKYPSNIVAAALNYRRHAEEMGSTRHQVDPDRDVPYLFAKSPRSSIADPGQPYVIPPGRTQIDWEGELAVVMGAEAKNLTLDDVIDHVFGFTILYDISDRETWPRESQPYNIDWFSQKSRDGSAPMGPYVVPKEFLPNFQQLKITTRVNDRVVQDSDTSYQIYDVPHLLRFVTSILTLYPGDVVATGTPEGVGAGRNPQEFLRAGDVVRIEIEGIGTLETPFLPPGAGRRVALRPRAACSPRRAPSDESCPSCTAGRRAAAAATKPRLATGGLDPELADRHEHHSRATAARLLGDQLL